MVRGDRWATRWHPSAAPRLRIICFAHAGGGASAYREWPRLVADDIEVCAVQLPGRQSRAAEPPYHRLGDLLPAMAQALRPLLDSRYVMFGHSLGAVISFELARHLRRNAAPAPEHLFVSGSRAPHLPNRRTPIHTLPDDHFAEAVFRLNGTHAELLQDPEMRELMIPALRADFTLDELYRYDPEPPLPVPITAFRGVDDSSTSAADVNAWAELTTRQFVQRALPGDHFFPYTEQVALLDEIDQATRAPGTRPVRPAAPSSP